jgi:hypothetical protein
MLLPTALKIIIFKTEQKPPSKREQIKRKTNYLPMPTEVNEEAI